MYTERSLLDAREVRATLAHRTDVLDEVKRLPLLPDGVHVTATLLADYFEVDAVVLRRVARKHAGELGDYGYRQLQGEELRAFVAVNLPERKAVGRALGIFPAEAALVLAMVLGTSEVAHAVRLELLSRAGSPVRGAGHGPVPLREEFRRRADADLGDHRTRRAETVAETAAEAAGHRLHTVANAGQALDRDFTVLSDGTVHCGHGAMEICVPARGEDSGPPYGPYYRCPQVEGVGSRGSRPLRPCGTVPFVEVVRRLNRQEAEGAPAPGARLRTGGVEVPGPGNMVMVVGTPEQIADVLRRGLPT